MKMLELIKKMIGSDNTKLQISDKDILTVNLAITVLLFDAAYADGECSEEEKKHLVTTLVSNFGVSREEIDTLIADRDKERKEHVNLFRYTRFINENFSEKKKIDLMVSVWRIILLDGHLEAHEDHFSHKLASLLNLSHSDLIDAKLQARKELP